jgi:hypothetical protein
LYKNVLESLSDEEFDGETDLFIAIASLVNEQYLMPPRKDGSSKKRLPNVNCGREAGHMHLYNDYFDQLI